MTVAFRALYKYTYLLAFAQSRSKVKVILANCLIYAWALLEYIILFCFSIVSVRFCSKMLPAVKFAEDKVLIFIIFREKC